MSRAKNKVTKLLGDYMPVGQSFVLHDGDVFTRNPEAYARVGAIDCLLNVNQILHRKPFDFDGAVHERIIRPDIPKGTLEFLLADEMRSLILALKAAVQTCKGQFFRDMADAIDRLGKPPVDPIRSWLLCYFSWREGNDFDRRPAPRKVKANFDEVRAALENAWPNDSTSDRQLRREIKDLGIVLSAGKPGRPRKKRK
jgi:hypothetical protein